MSRLAAATLLVLVLGACAERHSVALKKHNVTPARPPASVAPTHASSPAPTSSADAPPPTPSLEADATIVLPIPPRGQAAEAPSAGWCGETAIQQGLLHSGLWASQRLINRAGKPAHPDLYSNDIPVALNALGVRYTFYSTRKPGFDPFAAWVKDALEAGDPVLAGVKILPTQHPEWGLDHFVLVVGHGSKGLLVNTTWGRRAWVSDTTTPGLSFKNVVYGIRLRGLALPPDGRPARLSVVDRGANTVKLRIACEGLTTGSTYRVERRRSPRDKQPLWSETAIAVGDRVETELTVEVDRPSRFHCVPVSEHLEPTPALWYGPVRVPLPQCPGYSSGQAEGWMNVKITGAAGLAMLRADAVGTCTRQRNGSNGER